MKSPILIIAVLSLFAVACKKDLPEEVVEETPIEEVVDGYAKTILIEPTVSVSCGACPLAHHNIEVIEDSLSDVIHMSHYLYGALHHEYTDWLINRINKTVYTPVAHIQRRDEGDGTVYYLVSRLEEMIEGERMADAVAGLDVLNSVEDNMLKVEVEVNAIENFKDSKLRLQVFVVEKSVMGQGSDYDQRNYGNNDPDHPYYGQGDYIQGFEHTNVIRHVLSSYEGDMIELDGVTTTWQGEISLDDLPEGLDAYAIIAFVTDDDEGTPPILNAIQAEAQP